jgi:hypothetical protein
MRCARCGERWMVWPEPPPESPLLAPESATGLAPELAPGLAPEAAEEAVPEYGWASPVSAPELPPDPEDPPAQVAVPARGGTRARWAAWIVSAGLVLAAVLGLLVFAEELRGAWPPLGRLL